MCRVGETLVKLVMVGFCGILVDFFLLSITFIMGHSLVLSIKQLYHISPNSVPPKRRSPGIGSTDTNPASKQNQPYASIKGYRTLFVKGVAVIRSHKALSRWA